MKHSTAIKTLRKCADYYIKTKLAFGASLYEKGISTDEFAKRCYEERKQIQDALESLSAQKALL